LIGGCRNTVGVHRRPAECDIVTRFAIKGYKNRGFVILMLHDVRC
jgi:hypothetical protein